MHIQACTFKRSENGPLEYGIMIDSDEAIIDSYRCVVPAPVYDYTLIPYEGCIIIDLHDGKEL